MTTNTDSLDLLRGVPLFHGLVEADLVAVAQATTSRELAAGDFLFRQGDPGDALFVVVSGTLAARLDAGLESERTLSTFAPGDFFGEMALLTGAPRSATVQATSASVVLSLGKSAFDDLVRSTPEIALQLSRVLSSRLSATNDQLSRHLAGTTAVIVVGERAAGDEVLDAAIASIARQTRRGAERVNATGGAATDAAAAIAGARQRGRHAILVIDEQAARGTPSPVRRGETIWLLATSAERVPEARTMGAALRDAGYAVRLAYLGDRGKPFPDFPPGVYPPLRIVRGADRKPAVDSFARALIGATIGVALSGGAAQGTAHVGVLQALVTAGVPIDMIAGTSGGALYGSLVAAGLTVDEAKARVIHNTRHNLRDRSDYTLPRTGILRGASIERMIHESTNGARFEDLHFPLYAVAADLATGEEVVVERGPVSHGVRASISVPGIFEPFTVDGRLLVDGGVVNPLPVSVCRARGANFVIACSVPAPGKLKQGSGPQRYNILSVIVRSYYFAGDVIANANAADADVLIKPAVEGFGWRDYKSSPDIIEAGRIAGEAALGRIWERIPVVRDRSLAGGRVVQ